MFAPLQLAVARKETVPAGYLEGGTKDLGTHEFGHDGGADSQDRGSVDGETGEEEFFPLVWLLILQLLARKSCRSAEFSRVEGRRGRWRAGGRG